MQTPTGRSRRNLVTAHLTITRPPRNRRFEYGLTALTVWTVAVVGLYAGWFAGCSRAPIAATVVPLVFALITALALREASVAKLVPILVLVVTFNIGYDYGEDLDNPITVQQLLDKRNVVVSNAIFDELSLLDAQLLQLNLGTVRHDAILYGVGARIAEDPGLALNQQIGQLQQFRRQLRELQK